MKDFNHIPIIDLATSDRENLARQLVNICETVGFFYIVNHDVDDALCQNMMHLSKNFFDFPLEMKDRISIDKSPYFRGYTPNKGTEKERNECLRLGIDLPSDHPSILSAKPLHGSNPICHFMPELNEMVNEYILDLNKLAHQLLELFAIGLGLKNNFFTQSSDLPLSTLLLLKYPKMDQLEENVQGCRPHTDFHCLTFLLQDDVGGLQVQNMRHEWVNATPVPKSFVVNIGDLFSHWTRGRFVATPHRVLRITSQERYSIPYFFNVNYDTKIDPKDIDGQENIFPYLPKIAGEHVLDRVNAVYIKHTG